MPATHQLPARRTRGENLQQYCTLQRSTLQASLGFAQDASQLVHAMCSRLLCAPYARVTFGMRWRVGNSILSNHQKATGPRKKPNAPITHDTWKGALPIADRIVECRGALAYLSHRPARLAIQVLLCCRRLPLGPHPATCPAVFPSLAVRAVSALLLARRACQCSGGLRC